MSGQAHVLAIESSGPLTWLALRTGSESVFELCGSGANSHNEEIAPLAAALFKLGGIRPHELGAIVVGAGPGSFTGLRIGYAFAKGLAQAYSLPITEVSSLKAYAYAVRSDAGLIGAIADARRGEVFFSLYESRGSEFTSISEDEIVALPSLPGRLREACSARGISAPARIVRVHPDLSISDESAECVEAESTARALLELAPEALQRKFDLAGLAAISPRYVRAAAARTIAERQGAA